MAVVSIRCPFCSEATELTYTCQACGRDLRLVIATEDMALIRYNHALQMIQEEDWERAWQDTTQAINIFPLQPEIVLLAWRLSRELGYFNDAQNILESYKQELDPTEYQNALDQLHNELQLYNLLLEDADARLDNVSDLMVHSRIRELHCVSTTQPDLPTISASSTPARNWYWIAAGVVIALGLLNVWQITKNGLRNNQVIDPPGQTKTQTPTPEIEHPKADSLREVSLQAFIASMPTREQEVILREMWNQGNYEQLGRIESQSWFTRAARFMLIYKAATSPAADPAEAKRSIASLDEWTLNNADFPSFYGDACITLIRIYSSPTHLDPAKQKAVAERLLNWVNSMPSKPEYRQYLNSKVMEILHG